MPIRSDLRHHYKGPDWLAIRDRIRKRAGGNCEQCDVVDGSPTTNRDGKESRVQCGVAHLDHDPKNNADENLKYLCRACHLVHDQGQHKQTRSKRKDAARPLLEVAHG